LADFESLDVDDAVEEFVRFKGQNPDADGVVRCMAGRQWFDR
jgi:hypothetical protein